MEGMSRDVRVWTVESTKASGTWDWGVRRMPATISQRRPFKAVLRRRGIPVLGLTAWQSTESPTATSRAQTVPRRVNPRVPSEPPPLSPGRRPVPSPGQQSQPKVRHGLSPRKKSNGCLRPPLAFSNRGGAASRNPLPAASSPRSLGCLLASDVSTTVSGPNFSAYPMLPEISRPSITIAYSTSSCPTSRARTAVRLPAPSPTVAHQSCE